MSLEPLKKGQEVRLEISGSAFEGKAVARVNGLVVFVDGGVPGDVVNARIVKTKKNHAEARLVEVLKPSPLRTSPRCVHFGTCGGCKWQHVDYAAQLTFKRQHVLDAFERIGGFETVDVPPVIGAEEIYFYRNKMEYSFSDQQWLEEFPARPAGGGSSQMTDDKSRTANPVFLGLHIPQRYDKVLDIRECHLQSESSNAILTFVRDYARRRNLPVYSSKAHSGYLRFLVIREGKRTQERMVNIVTFDDRPEVMKQFAQELTDAVAGITTVVNTINTRRAQVSTGEEERVYYGEGTIHERLGNYTFSISASSFFQTNTAQAEKLYTIAKEFAQLSGGETVFDLYSGTGSIAITLSDRAREIVGIESVETSIRDAERNARLNGIQNCQFVLGDLKEWLTSGAEWKGNHPAAEVLVIDPPRSGMHPKVVEEICELKVRRIVYVSCNPVTQARDAKLLSEMYNLVRLQPVDMFPHTFHIENVALMELR